MFTLKLFFLHKKEKTSSGFTMIELCIAIIIFGIVIIPLLNMYQANTKRDRDDKTVERVENAISQIILYRGSTFSAPCPADRTLSIFDSGYGEADCASASSLTVGTCTSGGGICKVAGARSTTGNPEYDAVLIGAYPFRTIGQINGGFVSADDGQDGYNNKLTYAVSLYATPNSPAVRDSKAIGEDFRYGVISVKDEAGNNTAGMNDDALFAVFSHGKTARGAYTNEGGLVAVCDTGTLDGENCDNDSSFIRTIGMFEGPSSNFYDDYSYFFKDHTGDLWAYIYNPRTDSSTGHIRNLNNQNVGINTGSTTPTSKLTVNGDIRAVTTLANELCDSSGNNCVPRNFLTNSYNGGGTGSLIAATTSDPSNTKRWRNTCDSGQIAQKLSNGKLECVSNITIPHPPGGGGAHCPTGYYINKIFSNGCIICTDGNIYPSVALCN